jgi:hypothetical protein
MDAGGQFDESVERLFISKLGPIEGPKRLEPLRVAIEEFKSVRKSEADQILTFVRPGGLLTEEQAETLRYVYPAALERYTLPETERQTLSPRDVPPAPKIGDRAFANAMPVEGLLGAGFGTAPDERGPVRLGETFAPVQDIGAGIPAPQIGPGLVAGKETVPGRVGSRLRMTVAERDRQGQIERSIAALDAAVQQGTISSAHADVIRSQMVDGKLPSEGLDRLLAGGGVPETFGSTQPVTVRTGDGTVVRGVIRIRNQRGVGYLTPGNRLLQGPGLTVVRETAPMTRTDRGRALTELREQYVVAVGYPELGIDVAQIRTAMSRLGGVNLDAEAQTARISAKDKLISRVNARRIASQVATDFWGQPIDVPETDFPATLESVRQEDLPPSGQGTRPPASGVTVDRSAMAEGDLTGRNFTEAQVRTGAFVADIPFDEYKDGLLAMGATVGPE